jgi:hypothetical protein
MTSRFIILILIQFWWLYRVKLDNVADVSEVHATSFFRVERCTMSNFLCIIGLRVIQKAYKFSLVSLSKKRRESYGEQILCK